MIQLEWMILLWFMKWVIQTAFQTKIVCEKESTRASDFSATLKSLSDHFMNLLDLFFENNQLEMNNSFAIHKASHSERFATNSLNRID